MFVIREIEEGDYKKFIKLLVEQFEREEKNKKILKKRLEARVLKCILSEKVTILIAIDQDQVKGYVMIHWIQELHSDTPEALVSNLYVALHSRNNGIGRALLEAVVQKARIQDCSRLWLESSRNKPIYSKQFYKKRGWTERLDLAVFEFHF